MKTIDEIKEEIVNSVCALMNHTEGEGLFVWNVGMRGGEIDYFTSATSDDYIALSGDVLEEQLEDAAVRENWTRSDYSRWIDCVLDVPTLEEVQNLTRTPAECRDFQELEALAENADWVNMSLADSHDAIMEMLHRGIDLLDWNLDTVERNCASLDNLAKNADGEVSAMFCNLEDGGPCSREEASELFIRTGGFDIRGLKFGTRYNTDGALVLSWIESAMQLPEPTWSESQDDWYEDSWDLKNIVK